jgi:Xaa-Pro aminopeptidase
MLTQSGCLNRQHRFREQLAAQNIDAAVLTDYRDVYYFTGMLSAQFPIFLLLETGGGCWLVANTDDGVSCVDDCTTYEWNKLGTLNPNILDGMSGVVAKRIQGTGAIKRLGWQAEAMPHLLRQTVDSGLQPDEWVAVDNLLRTMQSRKDPDEVALIRKSIQADLAAYTAVQKAITPGENELAVLAAGQRGAMMGAGEKVFHDGDYQCGVFNGPARNRNIVQGEIYIVDAWTCYRGYWSDLSRAFVVGGSPTDLQQSVFDHIASVQREVPALLKPGTDGTAVWRALDARIREHPALADTGLVHHGGHAIGLRAHEMPDLNRDRGGTLEVGNVVSVEPGGYADALNYGVRIENMYLITEAGAENLSEYPMEIVPRA